MPHIHYKVSICLQKAKNNFTGEEELEQVEKIFSHANPIQARKEALNFFESYLVIISEQLGFEYTDVRSAYAYMKDLFGSIPSSIRLSRGSIRGWTRKYATVEMIADSIIEEDNDTVNSIIIFELSDYQPGFEDTIDLLVRLGKELQYYNRHQLDKGGLEMSVNAFDSEDDDVQNFPILEIPLSWEGMDIRPDRIEESNELLLELIAGGENQYIEFKPALVYNFSSRSFKFSWSQKIPQAICAFLNSNNGGLLFIGVTDNGEIQGLDYDYSLSEIPNARDYFLQQFNRMLTFYFRPFVRTHLESGIREINGKEIFVVKVQPATTPVFVTNKISDVFEKRFFVRGAACSNELREIEEVVQFCLARYSNAGAIDDE